MPPAPAPFPHPRVGRGRSEELREGLSEASVPVSLRGSPREVFTPQCGGTAEKGQREHRERAAIGKCERRCSACVCAPPEKNKGTMASPDSLEKSHGQGREGVGEGRTVDFCTA